MFVDRTVSLDTTAKIICGATPSLSQLAIAHSPVAPSRDSPLGGKLVVTQRPSGSEIERLVAHFVSSALPGAANPVDPREEGAVLELFSTDQTVTRLVMPAEGWAASPDGRVFRFLNSRAPNGMSPVALAVLSIHARNFHRLHEIVRWGHLRIESHAVGIALAQQALGVRLTLGLLRYCDIYKSFQRGMTTKLIAGSIRMPLDCADKRMWWTLDHVQ